jgi:hypothetical protein
VADFVIIADFTAAYSVVFGLLIYIIVNFGLCSTELDVAP